MAPGSVGIDRDNLLAAVLVPNCRKQHHGIDRDSSTAELSAPDSSIEFRILVPQPPSAVSPERIPAFLKPATFPRVRPQPTGGNNHPSRAGHFPSLKEATLQKDCTV